MTMSNISIIIVDDEQEARDLLEALLDQIPEIQILSKSSSVAEGLEAIIKLQPDIILLDVEMPGESGFDLLNELNKYPIESTIIFITAFDKFALEAFEFSAVDYLLKPVNPTKLSDAIKKVEDRIQVTISKQLVALKENLSPENTLNRKIVLKTMNNIHLINSRDIIQCAADDCYTIVECIDGEKIMVSRILKDFDEMLTNYGFFRIHRSHLVNLQHIKSFLKQDGGYVVTTNDIRIPVASGNRERLLRLFDELEKE